jgi:hypothetical protein
LLNKNYRADADLANDYRSSEMDATNFSRGLAFSLNSKAAIK